MLAAWPRQIVLIGGLTTRSIVTGEVNARIEVLAGGEVKLLRFRDFSASAEEERQVRLRHYQEIPLSINLPQGVKPLRVLALVNGVSENKRFSSQRWVTWQDALGKSVSTH